MSDFLEFVESVPEGARSEMLSARVIPSFIASVHKYAVDEMSERALRIWAVDMLANGIKITTCRRYMGTLHSLYKSWNKDSFDDPFVNVKNDLAQPFANPDKQIAGSLALLPRLLKKTEKSSDWVVANVILYLFYNVKASVADVVRLKFDDTGVECPQVDDLVREMRVSPQSKYVFPLNQGKRREGAIVRDLISSMHSTLRSAGIFTGDTFSRETVTSLWIASAMDCGIPLTRIRSLVNVLPPDYAFLSLIDRVDTDPRREAAVINRVAENFNDKSVRWYVMRLRHGVAPEDIAASLGDDEKKGYKELTFYYPVRKEVRKKNKKIETIETPYLPGLLFFRLRSDKVGKYMSRVGDMAWCYRVSNSPESPYSYITCREMMAFQRQIGDFTPDIEMELVTHAPSVGIGDKVRINGGGLLSGLEGVVRAARNVDGSVTYTLTLSDTSYIKWQDVNVKEAFVEPVSETVTTSL